MVVRLLKVKRQRDCGKEMLGVAEGFEKVVRGQLSTSLVRMGGCQQQK